MSQAMLDNPESDLAKSVAAGLRRRRLAQGKKLAEIAAAVGTTQQTVQRLETGNMTLSVEWLGLICAALGVQPYELFLPPDDTLAGALLVAENRAGRAELKLKMLRAGIDRVFAQVELMDGKL